MRSSQPLQVIITRPGNDGLVLCAALTERGVRGIHMPSIAFEEVNNQTHLQTQLVEMRQCACLVFISKTAAATFVALMPPQVSLPMIAAIGPGTAGILQAAGHMSVIYPADAWNSEGLVALLSAWECENKKIGIITGEGGQDQLEQLLLAAGAIVKRYNLYKRILPSIDMTAYQAQLAQCAFDAMICTSFEGVDNIKKLFGEPYWPMLCAVPLVVISERIKCLAEVLGFKTIWLAENATTEALVEVIMQKKDELCQIRQAKKM